jgi:CspA family cold shock protein
MTIGKVKWFNNAKGYGFILPEDGTEDLFAHYTSIEMEGYKTLRAGQPVNFELARGDKGLFAANITFVDTIYQETQKISSDEATVNESALDVIEGSHLETT